MLASQLALTALLVALGSVLADPVESKAAEWRDASRDKYVVDSLLVNKANVECTTYVTFRGNKKAKKVLFTEPGTYDRAYIDTKDIVYVVHVCGGNFVRANTGPRYLEAARAIAARAIAGKYPFVTYILNLPKRGLLAETGYIYQPRYDEEEGCGEEERR